jgi:hypothetical protein
MHTQDIILIFTHQNSKGTTNKLLFMKSFFFIAFFIQQKIYPKHVLPFVGIVLAETQQRRDIAMLIT